MLTCIYFSLKACAQLALLGQVLRLCAHETLLVVCMCMRMCITCIIFLIERLRPLVHLGQVLLLFTHKILLAVYMCMRMYAYVCVGLRITLACTHYIQIDIPEVDQEHARLSSKQRVLIQILNLRRRPNVHSSANLFSALKPILDLGEEVLLHVWCAHSCEYTNTLHT
jgi:hypothetical protein